MTEDNIEFGYNTEVSYELQVELTLNMNSKYEWSIFRYVYYPDEDHTDMDIVAHGEETTLIGVENAWKSAFFEII